MSTGNKQYILAFDQGTTSSRSILFDTNGRIVSSSQKEFPQIFPQPGWVEHDPEVIYQTQIETAREAVARSGVDLDRIAGIGLTNQRETAVMWEKSSGKPAANAVVWQCRRSEPICKRLRAEGLEEEVRKRTGLVIDAYFSAGKILWFFENIPGLKERAVRGEILFGTVDAWLLYRLTGKHRTDITNASRTMLFNIHSREWDDELLRIFDIPASILPEVRPSVSDFGSTAPSLFGTSLPVRAVAGDQHAALFGQACFNPGDVKNTYGTGCFLLMYTGNEAVDSQNRLLTTVAWDLGGGPEYALEGSVFVAGAALQWLRDSLGIIAASGESEALAESVQDCGGVYFVPAFVGLGAPHWDSDVRGTIVGLTRGSGRTHLVRAALESIALQSSDLIHAMEKDSGEAIRKLRVDGGAAVNNFLLQYQADILGVEVHRPEMTETTAFGAACLAGIGSGIYSGKNDVQRVWTLDHCFTPVISLEQREKLIAGWKKALKAAAVYR